MIKDFVKASRNVAYYNENAEKIALPRRILRPNRLDDRERPTCTEAYQHQCLKNTEFHCHLLVILQNITHIIEIRKRQLSILR